MLSSLLTLKVLLEMLLQSLLLLLFLITLSLVRLFLLQLVLLTVMLISCSCFRLNCSIRHCFHCNYYTVLKTNLFFAQFDKSLRKQHEIYDHYRRVGTICEARVFVVRPGSFRKLQKFIIANSSASYNQFKMPKKLRTKATLDLLLECVLDSK